MNEHTSDGEGQFVEGQLLQLDAGPHHDDYHIRVTRNAGRDADRAGTRLRVGANARRMNDQSTIQLRHEFTIVGEDNTTIATATVERVHGVNWLTNVWVHHAHRKNGYARRLVAAAVATFGNDSLWLNVYPYTNRPLDSAALTRFYAQFGFAEAGTPGAMVRRPQ